MEHPGAVFGSNLYTAPKSSKSCLQSYKSHASVKISYGMICSLHPCRLRADAALQDAEDKSVNAVLSLKGVQLLVL